MNWKAVVNDSCTILRNQHGDLYDEEFESLTTYIMNLERGDVGEFRSTHWKGDVQCFLKDMCDMVYYVFRKDMNKEYRELQCYINDLTHP